MNSTHLEIVNANVLFNGSVCNLDRDSMVKQEFCLGLTIGIAVLHPKEPKFVGSAVA